jgi:hypothetical protein
MLFSFVRRRLLIVAFLFSKPPAAKPGGIAFGFLFAWRDGRKACAGIRVRQKERNDDLESSNLVATTAGASRV